MIDGEEVEKGRGEQKVEMEERREREERTEEGTRESSSRVAVGSTVVKNITAWRSQI